MGSREWSSIIEAADWGDEAAVTSYISAGVDVNQKDHTKRTALYCAACSGHINIVRQLIEAGADVNYYPPLESPPVFEAARHSAELLQLLISAGANIHYKKIYTAIGLERESNIVDHIDYRNHQIIQILLNEGYNINHQDIHGQTLLMKMMASEYSSQDLLRSIQVLIRSEKLDLNLLDNRGKTAEDISMENSITGWHLNDPTNSISHQVTKHLYKSCVEPLLQEIEQQKMLKAQLIYQQRLNPQSYFSKTPSDIRRMIETFIMNNQITYQNEKTLDITRDPLKYAL